MEPTITTRKRLLEKEEDVLTQNAWDDINWTNEMIEKAQKIISQQKKESIQSEIERLEMTVKTRWDEFYQNHEDRFFRDRKWLFSEFPELLDKLREGSPVCRLLEVGCGVGNTVYPILSANKNRKLKLYCCDLSVTGIEVLIKRKLSQPGGTVANEVDAFVADVTSDYAKIRDRIDTDSLDFITLIFTLSALKPDSMKNTVKDLASLLKPGGMILFRDYARYDLTQLRFRGKSYLQENYYIRSDGTTSFFFTLDYVDSLFNGAGLTKVELKSDNRLLVNRVTEQKMYRCWIQAKYKKEG